MADISRYLNAILAAVYGEEVRGSIHDAIKVINDEVGSSTSKSDTAVQVANEAKEQSNAAFEAAQNAVDISNTANDKSDTAVVTANAANSKSTIALTNSVNAVNVATSAMESADAALTNSLEAVRTANVALDTSQNAYNIVINLKRIVENQDTYIKWLYEYMQIVRSTTENIVIEDVLLDSSGNNILDNNGDIIGERQEGFAAFVRRVMEHLERTA